MEFSNYFPVWNKLTKREQERLSQSAVKRTVKKETLLYNSFTDCLGLLVIKSGQIRVFALSEEGREITLYRLFDRDICLFSASCIMSGIQFEISIETEKDTQLWIIPADVYKGLMNESLVIANYTTELMAARFSEIMWLMEQIMWKSLDKRLAAFLLEESIVEGSTSLRITHEKIANHLGTAREVITRMLRYFQNEQLVTLARGTVEIADENRLRILMND